MAKKSDSFYFENFATSADCACRAAAFLADLMRSFDPERVKESIDEMHAIEQEADECHHEMGDALITAFITPLEREDLALVSDGLDVVVDRIEGVLHRIYFTNIQSIRPDALDMVDLVIRACNELKALIGELARFKRSKALREHVIAINTIEEEADGVYIEAMRNLHTTCEDVREIIAWRDIYTFLEYCADACESVAAIVQTTVMKNS